MQRWISAWDDIGLRYAADWLWFRNIPKYEDRGLTAIASWMEMWSDIGNRVAVNAICAGEFPAPSRDEQERRALALVRQAEARMRMRARTMSLTEIMAVTGVAP